MADEPIEITAALVGNPDGTEDITPKEFNRPYVDRRKVDLRVSPDDTLGQVLERAAADLGTRWPPLLVAFHDPERDAMTGMSATVTLVDAKGRATWANVASEATYRELLESAEAGVMAGDPRRPYVIMQPGRGNGGPLPDWETIKAIWDALDLVLGVIGAGTTLNAARKRLADRLRSRAQSASEVIEQRSGDWRSRGGSPQALDAWLDDRVWSSADLASALGCSESEAEAALWAFGFAHSPSCVWRRAVDEESKFLLEVQRLGDSVAWANQEQVRQVLERHSRKFLKTGKAPKLDWQDFKWLHPSPLHRPVARVITFWSRLRGRLGRRRG